ncbi:MAG TPA: thioredoxin family protein [Gaiellaceae bacterium]|nr:thioredoxin family protein [Gaiellaceae bacterium]
MSLTMATEAPYFELPGVDGRDHSLDDYVEIPVLAIVWSCNHCPYVQGWEARMKAIQRDYGDRGFRLVAISSNDAASHPADSFDEMKARAESQDFNFDYLYDEDQSVARRYGPERTPEVFLFDADRRLVYHGAIDDNRDEDAVGQHYLRDAIEALLEGREPPARETPPVGCTVKWKQ